MPAPTAAARGAADSPASAATRERLLDAAESLFARRGFAGASVRDITRAAACNVAAVNYHFGGKAPLYTAVFERRLSALRDQRIAAIRLALRAAPEPSLETLLGGFASAFFAPLIGPSPGPLLADLMLRELVEPRLSQGLFYRAYSRPVERELAAAIARLEPSLAPATARLVARSVVAQLVHEVQALRRQGLFEQHAGLRRAFARATRHVARFSAAGARSCREH